MSIYRYTFAMNYLLNTKNLKMSKESKKNLVVAENSVPEILLDVNFISDISETKEIAKVKPIKSELVIAKETLTKGVESNVRSVSSYFAQYRKQYKDVESWIKQAQAKNRRFNAKLVHDIINSGNLKPILAADDAIQALKDKPAVNWSADRLHRAFVKAVELPKVAKS